MFLFICISSVIFLLVFFFKCLCTYLTALDLSGHTQHLRSLVAACGISFPG